MPQWPYNRVSEYNRSLLAVGRGVGKPGRIEDANVRFRPVRPDPASVPNRPVEKAAMPKTQLRTVADQLRMLETRFRKDSEARLTYTHSGGFVGQGMYHQRQEGART